MASSKDPRVIDDLRIVKSKIGIALEEYEDGVLPLHRVELQIRQSILLLKDARKHILHG